MTGACVREGVPDLGWWPSVLLCAGPRDGGRAARKNGDFRLADETRLSKRKPRLGGHVHFRKFESKFGGLLKLKKQKQKNGGSNRKFYHFFYKILIVTGLSPGDIFHPVLLGSAEGLADGPIAHQLRRSRKPALITTGSLRSPGI